MHAVILAGGKGRRLHPYTNVLPKPLMPIGDRPVLEILLLQLRAHGVDRVTLAVGHLAALIETYFGDGEALGLSIRYSREDRPLGTAGPLGLIEPPTENFLVTNGDILTDLDYGRLVAGHRDSGAIATLAVFTKSVPISLGVLDIDEQQRVIGYTEKPTLYYDVSTGIYCFRPDVLRYVPRGEPLDLPDLVKTLVAHGELVRAHRFGGFWLDIGRIEDYETAQQAIERGEIKT